ncbi:hypothetical protein [Streptomyces sp. NPDC014623]|uniref:hypothetical protein n=1 Tax=Streptomyces sp. NPDC014623 TaxID=3364875 RepID=UPI0036F51A4C
MRTMLVIHMDTQKSSQMIENNEMAQFMRSTLERLRPEAAYFGPHSGVRTAFVVIDLEDPSQLPSISEPFFARLGARVEMFPVMTAEDVRTGLERYASS